MYFLRILVSTIFIELIYACQEHLTCITCLRNKCRYGKLSDGTFLCTKKFMDSMEIVRTYTKRTCDMKSNDAESPKLTTANPVLNPTSLFERKDNYSCSHPLGCVAGPGEKSENSSTGKDIGNVFPNGFTTFYKSTTIKPIIFDITTVIPRNDNVMKNTIISNPSPTVPYTTKLQTSTIQPTDAYTLEKTNGSHTVIERKDDVNNTMKINEADPINTQPSQIPCPRQLPYEVNEVEGLRYEKGVLTYKGNIIFFGIKTKRRTIIVRWIRNRCNGLLIDRNLFRSKSVESEQNLNISRNYNILSNFDKQKELCYAITLKQAFM